jgi:hypothetical protein
MIAKKSSRSFFSSRFSDATCAFFSRQKSDGSRHAVCFDIGQGPAATEMLPQPAAY